MARKYIVDDIVMYKNKIHTIMDILGVNNYEISYIEHPVHQLELSGVPITTEILEKNGWMLLRMYHWFIEKECLKLRLLELDNHSWYVYIGDNLIRRNMHSVSDLQHILFGLGINHEMEV